MRCAVCSTDGIKFNKATAKGRAVVRITRPCFRLTIQPKEQHMNQAELVNAIAAHGTNTGTSKATIQFVLDAQADIAQRELKKKGEITLRGLGKLTVKTSAARKGRNPATGAEIDIPAKQKPHFSAAKVLKDAVAG
jgi:DNA-binding protein HU-beta